MSLPQATAAAPACPAGAGLLASLGQLLLQRFLHARQQQLDRIPWLQHDRVADVNAPRTLKSQRPTQRPQELEASAQRRQRRNQAATPEAQSEEAA